MNREELYSKEAWELYMRFNMEYFGQLKLDLQGTKQLKIEFKNE